MIYITLFLEFFKIGLFTFGGGYAMIPLLQEVVVKYNWIGEGQFYEFLGVCEATPGPIAINMATYIGSVQGGILGSICATLGVVLPSFIIILLILIVFKNFLNNKYVKIALTGIKAVVLGLILSTGLLLLIKALGYNNLESWDFNFQSLIIFGLIIVCYFSYTFFTKKKMNAIIIIILSAIIGIGICYIMN